MGVVKDKPGILIGYKGETINQLIELLSLINGFNELNLKEVTVV